MPSMKRRIARNTIAHTLLRISQYVISFLMFPFIIGHIGVVDYGLYLLVGAFVGYFGLLELGVGTALEKYVAEFNAKDDKKTINKMVNTTFLFYFGVGFIIFLSVLLIGTVYVNLFNIESDQVEKARLIAYLTAIGALTSWPMRSFGTVLQGMQRFDLDSLFEFIIVFTTAIATIILLIYGYGIIELVLIGILIGAIGQIPKAVMAQRLLPYLSIKRKFMSISTFKKIFKFSSVVFLAQIVGLIVLGTDRIVIGAFITIGAITHYTIARKLHDLVSTASSLPTYTLLPTFSEIEAKKNWRVKKLLFLRSGKYRAAVILAINTPMIILTPFIIKYWMGSEYLFMATATQIFLIYWFFRANTGALTVILLASEKYKILIRIYIIEAVFNLILSLILVQWFGITGVILGTVIPHSIIIPYIIIAGLREVNISAKEYFKNIAYRVYPACIATFILLYSLIYLRQPASIIELGIMFLGGIGIFLVIFYYHGLVNYERKEIRGFVKKIFSKS